jgi:hypothetical protein
MSHAHFQQKDFGNFICRAAVKSGVSATIEQLPSHHTTDCGAALRID